MKEKTIKVDVNGELYEREVEARRLLVHFIRDDLDLTGTHVGCDTGNCGACTVLYNGDAIKSCMMLDPGRRRVDRDRRGSRPRRRVASAPGGVQRVARAAVRLL